MFIWLSITLSLIVCVLFWCVVHRRHTKHTGVGSEVFVEIPDNKRREVSVAAETAVTIAKRDFGTDLDYSLASLRHVESILAHLQESGTRGELSTDTSQAQVVYWGAYVGEVARRSNAGRWRQDTRFGGFPGLAVAFPRSTIYPFKWVNDAIHGRETPESTEKLALFTQQKIIVQERESIGVFSMERALEVKQRLNQAGVENVLQVDMAAATYEIQVRKGDVARAKKALAEH